MCGPEKNLQSADQTQCLWLCPWRGKGTNFPAWVKWFELNPSIKTCPKTAVCLLYYVTLYSGNNLFLVNMKVPFLCSVFFICILCHSLKTYLIRCLAEETWYASVLIFQCGTGWVSMLGLIGTHTHKAYHGDYSEKFTYFGMTYNSRHNLWIMKLLLEWGVACVFCTLYFSFLIHNAIMHTFLHIWGKKDYKTSYFILNFCCPSVTLITDCNIWLQVDAKLQEDLTKLDDLLGPPMSIPLMGWSSHKQMV